MKQIKVLNENGKFVGYIVENDEVVFTTEPQNSPNEASQLLTQHIRGSSATPNFIPGERPLPKPAPATEVAPTIAQPAPRRCGACGGR